MDGLKIAIVIPLAIIGAAGIFAALSYFDDEDDQGGGE